MDPMQQSSTTRLAAFLLGAGIFLSALFLAGDGLFNTLAARSREALGEPDSEQARIVRALELEPGEVVADVGAGSGRWTVPLAREVGPLGHVYATEVDAGKLEEIRERVELEELGNVSVVLGDQTQTGLPPGCCDAIFLRLVYHHFTDPGAMGSSLLRALRPGGRVAIVEMEDGSRDRIDGVPESRDGHNLALKVLVREVREAGFEVVETIPDWPGNYSMYCLVLRRAGDT